MNIRLNNIANPSGLVTLSHIPTIVSVDSEMTVGSKASLKITVTGGSGVSDAERYYIQVNDVKIYGTTILEKALNSTFYIAKLSGTYYNASMAYYLMKALSNTPLINNYNIYIDKNENLNSNTVIVEAKTYGEQYNLKCETNLPSNMAVTVITNGTNNDELNDSKVLMDIYIATQDDEMSSVGGETGTPDAVPEQPAKDDDWIKYTKDDYEFGVRKTAYQFSGSSETVQIDILSRKSGVKTSYSVSNCPPWITYVRNSDGCALTVQDNNTGQVRGSAFVVRQDGSGLVIPITTVQDAKTSSARRRAPRRVVVAPNVAGDTLPSNALAGQLEKRYIKNGIKFDISPLLNNYLDNGNIIQYNIVMSYIKDGLYHPIGSIKNNYAVAGYMSDRGGKYLDLSGGNILAQNVSAGRETAFINNTVLLYSDLVRFSMLFYSLDKVEIEMKYRDSAENLIYREKMDYTPASILDTIDIIPATLQNISYLDITVGTAGTIRYTNIKPLKYGDTGTLLDLYFTNSYGGTSFLPFTSSREYDFDVDSETFEPSTFDIYSKSEVAREKVYSRESETSITLKSCYMTEDALWTYRDLRHSYNIWYEDEDGVRHIVVLSDYEEEEVQSGIYQVTVKYRYKNL